MSGCRSGYTAEDIIQLVDFFEESYDESSDDEVDPGIRCDYVDENTGEGVLLNSSPCVNDPGQIPSCERDSLLLDDAQLRVEDMYVYCHNYNVL